MAYHQDIFRARMNGGGSGVDMVMNLLIESAQEGRHPAVRRAANALIESMSEHSWWVTAFPHRGGRGDARGADKTLHITVKVYGMREGNVSCHLGMDNRGHLFQITGDGLPDLVPWASPGSLPQKRQSELRRLDRL